MTRPNLEVISSVNAPERTPGRASLRLVESPGPSSRMDANVRLEATSASEDREVMFAELVRAVYAGDANPDDFAVRVVDVEGTDTPDMQRSPTSPCKLS